jgi:hypothetical protein
MHPSGRQIVPVLNRLCSKSRAKGGSKTEKGKWNAVLSFRTRGYAKPAFMAVFHTFARFPANVHFFHHARTANLPKVMGHKELRHVQIIQQLSAR